MAESRVPVSSQPWIDEKGHLYKGLSLKVTDIEWRMAETKNAIGAWKNYKSANQQDQRKAEEVMRDLQLRLAQTTDGDDRKRELRRKIHSEEQNIKKWKEMVQRWDEEINKAESDLLVFKEAKDKAVKSTVPSSKSSFDSRLVSKALTDLPDWHKLGLMLELTKIELDQIRVDFDKYGNARQRDEMVALWLHSDCDASWEKLCTALESIDQYTIAKEIRTRYYC